MFRAGPTLRLKQRRLAPSRGRTPGLPWIGTGSLDSTSNSPHDITLAELTRLLSAVRPTISETSPVGSHDRGRLPVRCRVRRGGRTGLLSAAGRRSWRRSGSGCSSGGGSAPWENADVPVRELPNRALEHQVNDLRAAQVGLREEEAPLNVADPLYAIVGCIEARAEWPLFWKFSGLGVNTCAI